MKYKSIIQLILFSCLLLNIQLSAQQLNPPETQFFANQYFSNPAMAGLENNELVVNTSYISQFNPIPGSPKNMFLTADYRFKENVALGLNVSSQKAGLMSQTRYMGSYAYHIKLGGNNENLRMGFSLGWTKDMIDYSTMNGSANDITVSNFNNKNSTWDADAGVAYENNGFCVQASSFNLRKIMNKEYQDASDYVIFNTSLNYKFPLGDGLIFNPKIAYRAIHNYSNLLDIGAELSFQEPFKISAMYHSNQSYGGGFSYLYKKQWQLVCIYTSPAKELKGMVSGIFELGFQFRIVPKFKK